MSDTMVPVEPPPVDPRRHARNVAMVIGACALVVLAVGLGVAWSRSGDDSARSGIAVAVDPPLQMPDAVLTDTHGQPFDLRAETAGTTTLVFFGYTNCPDACPIQMAVLGQVMGTLQPEVRDNLNVVFVTTDPDRDTPQALRSYLDQFDKSFIGLTGTDQQLVDLQIAAGLPVAVAEPGDDDGGYIVGHATQVLAFGADGVAREMYPLGVREADWARILPELVEASSS